MEGRRAGVVVHHPISDWGLTWAVSRSLVLGCAKTSLPISRGSWPLSALGLGEATLEGEQDQVGAAADAELI
jgi:hypothetical protein